MADRAVDELLASLLLETLPQIAERVTASVGNAHSLRADYPAVASVLDRQAAGLEAMGDRLTNLIDGLAAGTVRIVDEEVLRNEIEAAVNNALHRSPSDEGAPPSRVAELVLEFVKNQGALR